VNLILVSGINPEPKEFNGGGKEWQDPFFGKGGGGKCVKFRRLAKLCQVTKKIRHGTCGGKLRERWSDPNDERMFNQRHCRRVFVCTSALTQLCERLVNLPTSRATAGGNTDGGIETVRGAALALVICRPRVRALLSWILIMPQSEGVVMTISFQALQTRQIRGRNSIPQASTPTSKMVA
jgi:hypothetical protein